MNRHCFSFRLAASIILHLCVTSLAIAGTDTTRDFGAHVVHCKAMPSNELDSDVASQFNITRAKDRGVLNIAVMEKTTDGTMGQPVRGKITAHWSDLNGRMGSIPMREFQRQNAIYYIGEFDLVSGAMMTFDILISIDENRPPYSFTVKKQFPAE